MIIEKIVEDAKAELLRLIDKSADNLAILDQCTFLRKLLLLKKQYLELKEESANNYTAFELLKKLNQPEFYPELCTFLFKINDGHKIKIIRDFRTITKCNLRVCKDIVEKNCGPFNDGYTVGDLILN